MGEPSRRWPYIYNLFLLSKEFVVAGQKSDKNKSQSNTGGIMGLVSKVLGVGAIVLGALFFAAMFDVAHLGLLHTFASSAIVLVPLFAVFALAALFMTPKAGADLDALSAQIASLGDVQSKFNSQVLNLQNQIDGFSGQDVETLKARNLELQKQLDEIQQAEREKIDGEFDTLRQRNIELEEQIKKWAFETVGGTVGSGQNKPAKAA